ncbi:hypothetical protein N7499_007647 [Penicillium canescens]|nr:hypothetical protein N7522_007697 [Penicillium canescens]KAJ6082773.1 hypothetical protein N7499_007647 [Penicillium canescens]KAJ6175428.1 hypothetical protein N7485_002342 [Penicillium canescens]
MKAIKDRLRRSSTDQNLFSTEGAIGMKILSDPSNSSLDIVFVHGLTGNRETTWTHKKGTCWPQDLLVGDFPAARIMTFGYDVDVAGLSTISSSNRLYDHGQSLAYALVSQRENFPTRPILFIAHGFGGLVCQQALILSTQVDGLWQISNYAVGIIFMGTPHHAKKETVGTNPGPNDLQRVGTGFQSMLRRGDISLEVFCFYEAKQINDAVGRIVEEDSAVLRGYKNCSIEANHFNMAKFSGRLDAGYEHIQTLIASLIATSRKENEADITGTPNQASVGSSINTSCPGSPSSTNYTLHGHTGYNGFQGASSSGFSNFTFT